jgi:hypothetical protein
MKVRKNASFWVGQVTQIADLEARGKLTIVDAVKRLRSTLRIAQVTVPPSPTDPEKCCYWLGRVWVVIQDKNLSQVMREVRGLVAIVHAEAKHA